MKNWRNLLFKLNKAFKQNGIKPYIFQEKNRIVFRTNEEMKDEGFGSGDDQMIDLVFDDSNKVVFLKVFRLPNKIRNKGVGKCLVTIIEEVMGEAEYVMYTSASADSMKEYWNKLGFHQIATDDSDKNVYGCLGKSSDLAVGWSSFVKSRGTSNGANFIS